MQKINLFSVHESFKADGFVNVKFIVSLLLAFLLVTVSLAQADGLFDFQMKLAKGGNAEAQYKVGEMYETGFGVKQDQKEAMNWITKSAGQGHETAGFKLLYWDVEKNGLKGGNKARVSELKKKAKAGNPQAQYYVGKMNAYGVGMKKNEDEAIEWLNKAALVGVIEAESELVTVRETKQFKADRIAKEKQQQQQQAQLKAKQEREKQAKLEQQKKLKAQQDAKVKSDAAAKKKMVDAAALEKANQQKSYQEKMAAKKQAEANQRKAKEKAAQKKKAAEENNRKAQFESDPCSGKSARFLSTCK